MSIFEKNYSNIYDKLYANKDYSAEVSFVVNILKKNNVRSKTILDIGSGTGSHLDIFRKKGYNYLGIEKSKAMCKIALKKNINLLNKDIFKVNLKKKYFIITSLFHVISYFIKNSQLEIFFKIISKNLKKDGIFVCDFWYTPAVNFQKLKNKKKVYKDNYCYLERSSNKYKMKNSIVKIIFNFKCYYNSIKKFIYFKEIHKIRHFEIEELIFFSQRENLSLVSVNEMISGNFPSKKTFSVCAVFKKL
jgi:SAM-dependent methyltransferase